MLGVGNTIVSTFQVARIFSGGGADIGWATSTDAGTTWTNGFLPGITTFDGGTFSAASDPVVAYDATHAVWMISTLPIGHNDSRRRQPLVRRAATGAIRLWSATHLTAIRIGSSATTPPPAFSTVTAIWSGTIPTRAAWYG